MPTKNPTTTKAPAPSRSQSETTPGTRDRILRLTLELIGEEGIGAVTNRRLAAAAGVSLGSLTYHFPNQASLLRESLNLYVDEEIERLKAITAELSARDPRPTPPELMAEVQRIAAESVARHQPVAELELHLQAARDPALQETSRRCFAAYEDLAAVAFTALGVPRPERHARAVVAVITGLGIQWLGTGRRDTSDLTIALRTIIRGALAEGKPTGDGDRPAPHPST